MRVILLALALIAAVVGAASLTGCGAARTLYHTCRAGLCR
jgi:predicted small lipoprotein YifL